MKINKYLAVIALMAFFVSCEQDDDTAVAEQTSNIQVVVEPFSASDIDIIGQVGMNSAVVDLGFRLSEFSTTYNDSDVNIIYEGNTYTIAAGDSQVVVGPTTVDFEIAPLGSSVPFNGIVLTNQINFDDRYEISIDSRPSDLVVLKSGSLGVNARVYGQLPPVPANGINFLFDWSPNDDAGNDLDLRLRMVPGDIAIDYSGSVSNYEDTAINDGMADGMYEVKADSWSTIGGSIAGILFAMHPDGTLEVFETDLTGIAAGGVSDEVVLVNITKLGSDYTLYQ
jgi:hypothetical protein|tara:strand:+ start:569 stop:1414 length:846 start_codon:yes stop_codon:yes gene_type:complete